MRSRYLDVVTAVCELHVISTTRIHPDIDVSWIVEWRLSVTLLIRSRKTFTFPFRFYNVACHCVIPSSRYRRDDDRITVMTVTTITISFRGSSFSSLEG